MVAWLGNLKPDLRGEATAALGAVNLRSALVVGPGACAVRWKPEIHRGGEAWGLCCAL